MGSDNQKENKLEINLPNSQKAWINYEDWKAVQLFYQKQKLAYKRFLFNIYPDVENKNEFRKQYKDTRKFCICMQGNTQKMGVIDKETNLIYKINYFYNPTYEVIKNAKFLRYTTGFDF